MPELDDALDAAYGGSGIDAALDQAYGEPVSGTAGKPRVPGNIDLANRPRVKLPDGSIATVRSLSFGTDAGEVLVPTVSDDGQLLSDEQAIAAYRKSGKHLGIFGAPAEATAAALEIHRGQEKQLKERELDTRLENALWAADLLSGTDVEKRAKIYKLSEQTGVAQDVLEKNYDAIKSAWDAATYRRSTFTTTGQLAEADPDAGKTPGQRFREKNPTLAKLLLERPDMAWVMKDGQLNILARAFNAVKDQFFEGQIEQERLWAKTEDPDPEVAKEAKEKLEKGITSLEQLQEQLTFAPKPENVLVDEKSRRMQDGWVDIGGELAPGLMVPRSVMVPVLRGQETWAQLEIAKQYQKLKELRRGGLPTFDVESRILDLEQKAVRRDYQEGSTEQVFTDIAEGMASFGSALKEGGVLGATVGAAAGVTTFLATRSPAAARAVGGRAATIGLKAGTVYGTYELEAGGAYRELLQTKKHDGSPAMDEPTARLASDVYGVLATATEFAGGVEAQMINPGTRKAFAGALLKNPAFLSALKRFAKTALEEGSEEALQDATQQAVEYFARSHGSGRFLTGEDVEVSLENSLVAGMKGTTGSLGMGGVSVALEHHQERIAADGAMVDGNQLRVLAGLKESPVAQQVPKVVAEMFKEHASRGGTPATHAYVEAGAAVRLFQEKGQDVDEAATALFGPDGPQKIRDAIVQGGFVEVPVDQYVEKFVVGSEAGKALVDDTKLHPLSLTTRQATDRQGELEKLAEELADQATQNDQHTAKSQFDVVEEQLVLSGKYTPREAEHAMAPYRALVRTAAAVTGVPATKLFEKYGIAFGAGDEALSVTLGAPAPSRYLSHAWRDQAVEEQQRTMFIDRTTGALNDRAWARRSQTAKSVAVLKLEGVKFTNDTQHKHAAGDALYRAGARALAPLGLELFKVKGDFVVPDVTQEQLDAHLAKANESKELQGFRFTGRVDGNLRAAAAAANKHAVELEAANLRAARGARPLNATGEFLGGGEKLTDTKVPGYLKESFGKTATDSAFAETFTDQASGLLNKDGFESTPDAKFYATADLDNLRNLNAAIGEEASDQVIEFFSNLLREQGAHEFYGAKVGPDEYNGKGNDEGKLKAWWAKAQETAERVRIPIELDEAFAAKLGLKPGPAVIDGLPFSFGVGQTLDDAERAAGENKAEREAAGLRGEGTIAKRIVQRPAEGVEGARPAGEGDGQAVPRPAVEQRDEAPSGPSEEAARDFGRQRYFEVARLEQPSADLTSIVEADRLEAPTDKGIPRGYTDVLRTGIETVFRIALNKNSDMSTWLHESGHVFLELFSDLAELPGAPKRIKEDWQKTMKYLGIDEAEWKSTAPAKRIDKFREQHERFARSFEAYLREGKAPSAKLVPAFTRFKLWLKKVYRDVKALRVELNPEIRGVFDRLLATENEVNRQARRQGTFKPHARDLLGMTPEQYETYKGDLEDRLSYAGEVADFQNVKDAARETEAWWKAELKEEVAKAGEEYEQLPARKVQRALRGQLVEGVRGEPIGMDRETVYEMIGEAAAKKAKLLLKKNGAHPDSLAKQFGHATGKALLEDLLELPEKSTWSEQTGYDRMLEKHPDVMSDRAKLAELVGKGLHGDRTEKWLLDELVAFKRRMSAPGEQVWTKDNAPIEAIRLAAKKIAERTVIGRLSPGGVLQQERAAREAALKAASKDQFGLAFTHTLQALQNMYLWRELTAAREERGKFLDLAAALSKDTARAKLGKARPIYRDSVDALLAALQLGPEREGNPGVDVGDLVEQMDADGQTVGFDEAVLNRVAVGDRGYKGLTLAEMRTVRDTLLSIQAAAKGRTTALFGDKRMDAEELEEKLLNESPGNLPPLGPIASSESAKGPWRRFKGFVAGLDGSLLRPEQMLKWMGDSWVRALFDPLQNAKKREVQLLQGPMKRIDDAFRAVPLKVKNTWNESIDGRALFPNHQVAFEQDLEPPSTRGELIMLALNMGNESNLARLTIGRNITLPQLQNALELLTKEELDLVQSIWDASEDLWPLAEELEERDSGLKPERLERRPLVTRHGTYGGGYFPAVYDWRVEATGERQLGNDLAALLDPRYVRPGTARGHLKNRVDGFTGVISLEPATILRGISQAAHDIAYREAVKSVGGLLLRPALRAELGRRLGPERAKQFLQWVKDVGQMRGLEGAERAGELLQFARWARGNTALAALGYSLTTAAGDVANLVAAIPRSQLSLKHWGAAMLEFSTSPFDSIKEAHALSGELASRRQQLREHLQQQVRDLPKGGWWGVRGFRWVKDHAFAFLEFTDLMTSTPIWMAAYRQAQAKGLDEAESIRWADGVIRENFPGASAVDLPGVLRDKGFVGTSLMFYRYFSVVYNSNRDILHPLHTAEDGVEVAKRVPKVAGRLLAFMTAAVVFSELLSGRGREDDEDFWQWYMRKLIFGGLQSIPWLGEAASGLEAKLLDKQVNPRAAPIAAMLNQVAEGSFKLDPEADDAAETAQKLLQAFAPPAGLPTSQPVRTLRGAAAQSDDPARNPVELLGDLWYGRREGQPENPASLIGEAIEGSER